MKFRSHPSSADAASECETWSSLVARQFTREWIAAGQQPLMESAPRRISHRSTTPDVMARLGTVLQRTLFNSRHPS